MARGKKAAKALNPEERLEQALVPEEEQPYAVPGNWCWLYGFSIFLPMETYKPEGDFFYYIDIDSIDNKQQVVTEAKIIPVSKAPSRARRKLHIGDTVFSMVRPYLMNIAYIDESLSGAIASTGFYVCSPKKILNRRYNYYMMISPYVVNGLNASMKGDNSPSIRRDDLEGFRYPIAPLAEQQRIVDRIEGLFARLDEAKEKAQAVLDGFELRKSAILHKAFSGELTERWRQEHGVGLDSWHKTVFKNILDVRDGTHDSPQYHDKGVALVTSKNLKNGVITNKDVKFISKEDYDKINKRSKVDIGDVLFAMIGTIGNPVVVEQEPNYAIKNIALFKNIGKVNPYMIKYYLETKKVRDKMNKEAKGSTQRFVSLGYLRNLAITIPTETEQEQMVAVLDSLLFKEQQVKAAAESVLEQIDTMKKSILARAFRGELGTDDPGEESAVGLLLHYN